MEYGCIGEKLSHSFSKEIHSKLFDYNYELCEISKDKLDSFMAAREFKAINVTIPYKQSVIKHLDYISDEARKIGAVNTIVNREGKLYGYNTDFIGMRGLILKSGIELSGKKVLILGSGGTSRTARAVCENLNAKEIFTVSRNADADCICYDEAYQKHTDCDVLINTTPCGMYPNVDSVAVDIDKFDNLSGVFDAVYNPISSLLVTRAKQKGICAVGGLYMLVLQAAAAAEHFVGLNVSEEKVDSIYSEMLNSKKNIALIGMPSSGKTTVGKEISKQLDMQFIDTDLLIEQKAGLAISKIFKTQGEAAFREIEAQVIREVSILQHAVISTGGGAVLRKDNVEFLKLNSDIYFIDRDLSLLTATCDRPLSSKREDLEKRYHERYDIYCASADKRVENNGDVQTAVDLIRKDIGL